MKTVKYKNYTITKMDSGTIQATKDGQISSPTKPLLRELAQELNINIENSNGNLHITRQLGALIIRAIENKTAKLDNISTPQKETNPSSKNLNNEYNCPIYNLTLHQTYYDKGFFNLGISVDKYIRSSNGTIHILLGESKLEVIGNVNRNANLNSTPRIFGGDRLKNWFQTNFNLKDLVDVHILTPDTIWITKT